jgi:hypothetical protein
MSANSSDMGKSDAVRNRLYDLRKKQLLVQDDMQYLQALGCGDAWIAVGPSDDLLSLARRSSLIGIVVPASGTALQSVPDCLFIWHLESLCRIECFSLRGVMYQCTLAASATRPACSFCFPLNFSTFVGIL